MAAKTSATVTTLEWRAAKLRVSAGGSKSWLLRSGPSDPKANSVGFGTGSRAKS
jgi:hypothetical protein